MTGTAKGSVGLCFEFSRPIPVTSTRREARLGLFQAKGKLVDLLPGDSAINARTAFFLNPC